MIESAASQAGATANGASLVRGSKSSTGFEPGEFPPSFHDLITPETDAGMRLVVKREWDGEYRGTVRAETRARQTPPRQSGDRWTERLSGAAQKNIEHSAKYMASVKRGFRVFMTLTLDDPARAELKRHDAMPRITHDAEGRRQVNPDRKTLGRMITEQVNSMQQRHRNGLTLPAGWFPFGKVQNNPGKQADALAEWRQVEGGWQMFKYYAAEKIGGTGRPFEYCWVIENPASVVHTQAGPVKKENPHVHLMMNWSVKKDQFRRWAAWIERLWGMGYVKLEKLRKPGAAAAYMAKAARYIGKGTDGTQGTIRGNRYFISSNAKAPQAETLGIYKLFNIWGLIKQGALLAGELAEAGKKRRDMFFHYWGFGANNRQSWGELCQTLKAAGFRFEEVQGADHSWTARRFTNNNIRAQFGRLAGSSHANGNIYFTDQELEEAQAVAEPTDWAGLLGAYDHYSAATLH